MIEKNKLDDKLKSLEEAVKKLQPLQAEVERNKADLELSRSSFETQLGQERQSRQALLQKHNDVVVKANAINADNQLLVRAVKEREQWIEQCGARNKELRSLNLDILNKYREKDLLKQFVEIEPFTGIGQIETETVVEDYKYKLQQLKITPFKAADEKSDSAIVAKPEAAPANGAADNPEVKQ